MLHSSLVVTVQMDRQDSSVADPHHAIIGEIGTFLYLLVKNPSFVTFLFYSNIFPVWIAPIVDLVMYEMSHRFQT